MGELGVVCISGCTAGGWAEVCNDSEKDTKSKQLEKQNPNLFAEPMDKIRCGKLVSCGSDWQGLPGVALVPGAVSWLREGTPLQPSERPELGLGRA